jgi:N6-L-threonylcarbamoyladenine synthase
MPRIGRYEELGATRDDAAGEAFDKIGKMLGIPYPAGPVFEKLAQRGDRNAVAFSRARLKDGPFDFSFSGLKTAARLRLEKEDLAPRTTVQPLDGTAAAGERSPQELESLPQRAYDILASAQEAIVEMLAEKLTAAVRAAGVQHAYLAGGVAANGRLRERLQEDLAAAGATLHYPPPRFCTDNAAMIACAGAMRLRAGEAPQLETAAFARGALRSWG